MFWEAILFAHGVAVPLEVQLAPAVESPLQPIASKPMDPVSRVIGGIISYARWPVEPQPLRLCISGVTQFDLHSPEISRASNRTIVTRRILPNASTADCDMLYLGTMDAAQQRQMLQSVRNRSIVSIVEFDPQCRSGAMFCLRAKATGVTFQLSIDAISRSSVRIDPRVLRATDTIGGTK